MKGTIPKADRQLTPGRRFKATYKKQEYFAEVAEDGTLTVRTGRGRQVGTGYTSPSKAGVAVTGYPTNGWRFWQDVVTTPKAKKASKPKAKKASKPKAKKARKVDPPVEPPEAIVEETAAEHDRNIARAKAEEQAI